MMSFISWFNSKFAKCELLQRGYVAKVDEDACVIHDRIANHKIKTAPN